VRRGVPAAHLLVADPRAAVHLLRVAERRGQSVRPADEIVARRSKLPCGQDSRVVDVPAGSAADAA
jgi:tRNA A58 N-methylase Trm61